MLHDELQFDLKQSAAVKLLGSPHAALILSFLMQEFKEGNRLVMPHSELSEHLEDYLETLAQALPGSYSNSAQQYLRSWTDEQHRFLRRYYESARDDPVYELTPDTERAIRWVTELRKSEFVGTESRFLRVFDLLEEIVTYGSEDVQARLLRLESERDRIQAQIDEIRATGKIEQYSQTQVRERFYEAAEVARRLLADFREVEENFRQIARQVQAQQLEAGARKGSIIGHVLDADAALKESDQGRSFYAFWEFLISPTRQEALRDLLDEALHLPELQSIRDEGQQLRAIKGSLIEAGRRVIESNRWLSEQIRRLLDEQSLAEQRRVLELAAEIKQFAAVLTPTLSGEAEFWEYEEFQAAIEMPMERQWWEPTEAASFDGVVVELTDESPSVEALAPLYGQFFVDSSRLSRQVAQMLESHSDVTLAQVAAAFPIEKGLAEVLAYCTLAARDGAHQIVPDATELLWLGVGGDPRPLRVPLIRFRREERREP